MKIPDYFRSSTVTASEDATHAILRDPSGYDPVLHGPPYMPTKTAASREVVQELLRKTARGGASRIAKTVQAHTSAFEGLPYGELATLLVFLRGLSHVHQSAHWATKGPQSYADHQLFDRVYGDTFGEIDSVGERLVGLAGPLMVEPVRLAKQAALVVEELSVSVSGPFGSGLVEVSLLAELRFLLLLQALTRSLREAGVLTAGTDNLLAGIADTHEGHVYLLRQSVPLPTM